MKQKIERLIARLEEQKSFAVLEMKKKISNYSQQWCITRIETLELCIEELKKIATK